MSGGGGALKTAGGILSSGATGGLLSTDGKGLLQGGNLNDYAKRVSFGLIDADKNKVDVPKAGVDPTWNLSGADGKLRNDLLLGNSMPQSFDQSQAVLNRLQDGAMAQGPSQSAQYMQQANTRNTQNAMGQADAQAASGMAAMSSQLAARGGLESGSRERMAKSAGMANMMGKQKIMNDSMGNNLEILANDEKQKQATLQALPASLLAQAGVAQSNKQFDIQNTLNTVGGKYNADKAAWAATQSAREQAQLANKNNGLLGLGIAGL